MLQTPLSGRPLHYSSLPRLKSGVDITPKFTEFFDGSTDDFGVFKEGPASTVRLEYLRSLEHTDTDTVMHRYIWSPFETHASMRTYSPLHYDYMHHSSRDNYGHRSGSLPGRAPIGHYKRQDVHVRDYRFNVNGFPQYRVPKWLACVVNDLKRSRYLGFFLYANGAYVVELLTYKQIPRLIYNKPFQGSIPTIGQTVTLNEVTYGKELHTLNYYPGKFGAVARKDGESAIVLRGTEPNLVPILCPTKEIRLFEGTSTAVFGRRAGVLREKTVWGGQEAGWIYKYIPHRPRVGMKHRRVQQHESAGGNGWKANPKMQLMWNNLPFQNVRTKHWLSAYVLKHGRYLHGKSVADIKAKSYSWASRDPVYRTAYMHYHPFKR